MINYTIMPWPETWDNNKLYHNNIECHTFDGRQSPCRATARSRTTNGYDIVLYCIVWYTNLVEPGSRPSQEADNGRWIPRKSDQPNTISYNTIPYHTIKYNTIPYHTIPTMNNTIPRKTASANRQCFENASFLARGPHPRHEWVTSLLVDGGIHMIESISRCSWWL